MSVKPIPEGYTSLTPFLCIDGAWAAIDFYDSVFGAKLVDRMDGPGDTVAHAEPDFGNGRLQLSDPQEAYQIAAADPTASATHSVALYCEDVDDMVARVRTSHPKSGTDAWRSGPRRTSGGRGLRLGLTEGDLHGL